MWAHGKYFISNSWRLKFEPGSLLPKLETWPLCIWPCLNAKLTPTKAYYVSAPVIQAVLISHLPFKAKCLQSRHINRYNEEMYNGVRVHRKLDEEMVGHITWSQVLSNRWCWNYIFKMKWMLARKAKKHQILISFKAIKLYPAPSPNP